MFSVFMFYPSIIAERNLSNRLLEAYIRQLIFRFISVCLNMNRELINLLTSICGPGSPVADRIWQLQEHALEAYLDRLVSTETAATALKTFLPAFEIREIAENFIVLKQSWWLQGRAL
jgi:hypothetical protein